jgi:hypothetical protein
LSARKSALFAQPRQSVQIQQNIIEEEEEEEVAEVVPKEPADISYRRIETSMMNVSLSAGIKQAGRASFTIVPGPNDLPALLPAPASAEVSVLLEPESSPLDKLAAKCWRQRIVAFSDVYADEVLADSVKVGEGAFGEVYLLGRSGPDRPVLKIVPVGGEVKVNDENQAGLTEMLSEVVISNTLSNLRNGKANCTQGMSCVLA